MVYSHARKSELFWRRRDEITRNIMISIVTPSLDLSSGKSTSGASEHRWTLSTAELKHQTNLTPIPVLYKKNFTKLPKWDFEDVYMQSSKVPRPVRFFPPFLLPDGICATVLWMIVLYNAVTCCVCIRSVGSLSRTQVRKSSRRLRCGTSSFGSTAASLT